MSRWGSRTLERRKWSGAGPSSADQVQRADRRCDEVDEAGLRLSNADRQQGRSRDAGLAMVAGRSSFVSGSRRAVWDTTAVVPAEGASGLAGCRVIAGVRYYHCRWRSYYQWISVTAGGVVLLPA